MKRKTKIYGPGVRNTVIERMRQLFDQADRRREFSDKYVEMARKLSMRYKVPIPGDLQKRFCKHCHRYLIPGENCRVRTRESKVVYYCLNCKMYMRFPFKAVSGKKG